MREGEGARRLRPATLRLVLAFLLALLPSTALAQPTPAYQNRAAQLLTILTTPGGEVDFFSDLFLKAVPIGSWHVAAADLRRQFGAPQALGAVRMESATAGQVEIRYARATVGFSLVVAPGSPGRVIGLRIVGVQQADDNMAKLMADIAALPGRAAFAVATLGDPGPRIVQSVNGDARMATASTFKLVILAELARAVAARERRWDDVIPLDRKSFSGRLLAAPDGAPMTLHSLALAMIAESDNSAADTLMLALGRDQVDAMTMRTGGTADALPILTTAEAFALKMPSHIALRSRYAAASPDDRRALLRDNAASLTAASIDIGSVADKPVAIDSIEWFASPRQDIALLDWLRRDGGDALPILAANPGIAPADAQRWRYLGYKGGSEPGVVAMTFLAQARDGQWYAISASWNDPAARVDDAQFAALLTRALNLLAR